MMYKVLIFCVLIVLVVGQQEKGFEESLSKCKGLEKDELEKCLLDVLNDIQHIFYDGDENLNFTGMDPLNVGDIILDQNTPDFKMKAIFPNHMYKGMSDYEVQNLSLDYAGKQAILTVLFPEIRGESRCSLDGSFLFLTVKGNGTSWTILKNVETTLRMKMKRAGDSIKIAVDDLKFQPETVRMRFNGLFENDPILSETVNTVLSENAAELLEEIKPQLIKNIASAFERVANQLIGSLDVSQIPGAQFI